jgi:hypothetical protein
MLASTTTTEHCSSFCSQLAAQITLDYMNALSTNPWGAPGLTPKEVFNCKAVKWDHCALIKAIKDNSIKR